MMRYRAVAAAFVVAFVVAFLAFGSAARADISICNDFVASIDVALAYPTDEAFVGAGWWRVEPNKCISPNFAFHGDALYYTADSDDYKEGNKSFADHWGNKINLYVTDKAFNTDAADRPWGTAKSEMFSAVELTDQQKGKALVITLHFSKGTTSIDVKIK
jgi:uncharacterized membrane protein